MWPLSLRDRLPVVPIPLNPPDADITLDLQAVLQRVYDAADYGKCVDLAEAAGYAGPYTLIFDSEIPREWDGLALERDFIVNRVG